MTWELTEGNEQVHGRNLRRMQGAQAAGSMLSENYVRPGNRAENSRSRGARAAELFSGYHTGGGTGPRATPRPPGAEGDIPTPPAGGYYNPSLAPPAGVRPGAATGQGASVVINQRTTVAVAPGGDAAETARRVGDAQGRVNADLLRNTRRAVA